MVSWWNCSVGKPSSVEDTRVIVLSVSPSATWKETGIDLDGPLCLRGFLFDRKTNGHVERVSAAHLGDFAEVWEDQLEGLCDAFGGDNAQLPEEVGSPGKHLSRDGGEDDACDDPQAMSVICFSESDGIRRGVCE